MPALNFKRQFAVDVRSGKVRQAIREMRKRPFRIGDRLQLWINQRSSTCERIGFRTCRMAVSIEIISGGGIYIGDGSVRRLPAAEALSLVIASGFRSVVQLTTWAEQQAGGLPFCGQLIMW